MIPPSTNQTNSTPPGGSPRYPQATFDSDTDYVKFNFYDYVAPFSAQGGGTSGASLPVYNQSSGSVLNNKQTSTVYLYMPEDIEGQYGASWNETNLSEIAKGMKAFGEAASGDVGGTIQELFNTAKTTATNFATKGTGVVNVISDILQKSNFGSLTVNDIFSATTGQILNPNTEVLYKGPKMRNFSLNFKMAPRNQPESDAIKKIIQIFKYATLPKFGGNDVERNASFVRVPQIVDVTFMKGNNPHPWVTQYKPAVITDFSVSYTPDGAWATLPNGSPVATTIKISFQETKMVYADEVVGDGATY
jgi:hypothetical protein